MTLYALQGDCRQVLIYFHTLIGNLILLIPCKTYCKIGFYSIFAISEVFVAAGHPPPVVSLD